MHEVCSARFADVKSNDGEHIYVTDDATSGVATLSLCSPDINGYPTVYTSALDDNYAGFHIYNGMAYTASNEPYTTYWTVFG